jgi:RHS repeat-associated protein
MIMPGQHNHGTNGYWYEFNGQEKETEINGNSLDFGERIYNGGLGRFLSIDKLTGSYPWWSLVAFAGNT